MSPVTITDQGMADGIELSPYARRLPKPKKTGDGTLDEQQRLQHVALQKTITLLQQHGDAVFPILASLVGIVNRKSSNSTDQLFPSTYCKCRYLPKYWLATWLCQATPLKISTLKAVGRVDKNGIRSIFEFLTQLDGNDSIPPAMLDKVVCAKALAARMRAVIPDADAWVAESVPKSGKIDWGSCGVYIFELPKGGPPKVTHRRSGDTSSIPCHVSLDGSWLLRDNIHDMLTCFVKDDTVSYVHTYFKGTARPHRTKMSKDLCLKSYCDELDEACHSDLVFDRDLLCRASKDTIVA
jgi:hypothetical protein